MTPHNPTSGINPPPNRRALLKGIPAGLIAALAAGNAGLAAEIVLESEIDRRFAEWEAAWAAFCDTVEDTGCDHPIYLAVTAAEKRLAEIPPLTVRDLARKIFANTSGEPEAECMGEAMAREIVALAQGRAV